MPRLELCGAHLLAILMHEVSSILKRDYEFEIFCWTDAQIVLHWLNDHPSKWKTFVATRVSAVLLLLPGVHWQHVKLAENPADIVTRGSSPAHLKESRLWWCGPAFLLESPQLEPGSTISALQEEDIPERRATQRFARAQSYSPEVQAMRSIQLSKLIVYYAHEETLHGAQQLTLSYLTRTFWIVHGHSLVHTVIKSCVRCARFSNKLPNFLMGELPRSRITASRPFLKYGVDYAGPLKIRVSKGRGHRSDKGYLCIFVCLVTRALHIEVVSDCTTIAFIAAFKRFVSRRGRCEELWSDNGKTFPGADTELKRFLQQASRNEDIASQLENDGTRWKFIPSDAPHFGGIWESAVKSTKHHLRSFRRFNTNL